MNAAVNLHETDVLLVVDVQRDFCEGGPLAVPRADEIVPIVNRAAQLFPHVVLTQDWHPSNHLSFVTSHAGRRPFEIVEVSYGEQVLWPDHCIQGTSGADFHPALAVPHAELILRKGYRHEIDSYSAFFENDQATPTGLCGYLRDRGFERIFLAGLALDFCVRYSAEDASESGFKVVVLEDACRAIDVSGSLEEARRSLAAHSVMLASSSSLDAK